MSGPHMRQHKQQHPQLNYADSHPPLSYWNHLSKIWLTRRALKELNRRNNKPNERPSPYRRIRRPLTRSRLIKWAKDQRSVSEILNGYSEDDLEEVKRFSRLGGPNLSDLRGYPEPTNPLEHSTMPPTNHLSASKNKDAINTANTKNTGPYSRNFEQLLIDYGVFPPSYKYPDGRKPEHPKNLDEIKQRAKQRRPSLTPSQYTDKEFEEFQDVATKLSNEDHISRSVVNTIEGSTQKTYTSSKVKFANLQSLFDYPLVPGNPDLYDGAPPEQLDRRVRERLYGMVVPSTLETYPITPNFFLHLKGPDGTAGVAQRQCVHDGALGERSQHQLRSYGTKEPKFDNNAHTITSVYIYSTLWMYTIHTAQPSNSSGRQEYYTHLIGSWAMAGDIETFRKGAAAFRNLRDWAKEQRDEAIGLANNVADQVEDEQNSGEEGEKNSGEEEEEPDVVSTSTLRAPGNGIDSNNAQAPSAAKRPSPASTRGRPSKRTRVKR